MLRSSAWRGATIERSVDRLLDSVDAGHLLWVDLESPTPAEIQAIEHRFGLDPLLVEDIAERDERPKVDRFGDITLVVAYSAELSEVAVCLGDGWVITVRNASDDGRAWDVKPAVERVQRTCPGDATPAFVLYAVLDELVDGYFVASDRLEDDLEELEDLIFADDPAGEDDIQQRMFRSRRQLLRLRRKVLPLRDVLSAALRGEITHVAQDDLRLFQDVFDHLLRTVDLLDSQRELLGNAADAHLAIISNRMNSVMKTMTSWGAILLGAALVAGIYGMNFTHMPELDWRLGYPFALGIMAATTIILRRLFKRRGWL